MAGRPIERKLLRDVEAKGGWEPIIEQIASGVTIKAIAERFGVSRGFFSMIIHRDDARSERVKRARYEAAYAHADDVLDIADSVEPDRDEIARAKLRVDARMFIAKTSNDEFRDKGAQINVNVSVEKLHLDALRVRGNQQALEEAQARALLPPVVDAEIESAESEQGIEA